MDGEETLFVPKKPKVANVKKPEVQELVVEEKPTRSSTNLLEEDEETIRLKQEALEVRFELI